MTHESGSTSGQERPAPPPPYGQPPGRPSGPYGVPPSGAHPVPYGQPVHHQNVLAHGYPPGVLRHPDARPGTVLAAAIVTMVSTGLVLAVVLVGIVALLVARSTVEDELASGLGPSDGRVVYSVIVLVLLGFLVWCVSAIVLAVLALKRHNWARILLTVSSGFTALVSLLAITGGISVVTLGAAIAVIVCLFTGGANDWFHREHLYSPPVPPKA